MDVLLWSANQPVSTATRKALLAYANRGGAIEVLAEATSPKTGKIFPQVFIVKHPKARIVGLTLGLTLGHDAPAHDLPAYQTLLKNAVQRAAGK